MGCIVINERILNTLELITEVFENSACTLWIIIEFGLTIVSDIVIEDTSHPSYSHVESAECITVIMVSGHTTS